MRDLSWLDLTLRIAIAAGAAGLLGLERELRGHPAGVRTHTLVAVGAALFTIAGAYGFGNLPHAASVDPARIAAQVASGVGFLGAGAILRQGLGVRGLTTAATLWLAAAIGVASGASAYPAVAICTAVMLLMLAGMRFAKPLLTRWGRQPTVIELDYRRGHGTLGPVLQTLHGLNSTIEHLDLDDEDDPETDGIRHVSLQVSIANTDDLYLAVDRLRERPEVAGVRVTCPRSTKPAQPTGSKLPWVRSLVDAGAPAPIQPLASARPSAE